jgi:glycosyltransferase involved in cell wall biosynthesis
MRVMVNCLPAGGPETGGGFTFVSGLLEALARIDGENEYILVVSDANRARFDFGRANFRCVTVPHAISHGALRVLSDSLLLPAMARSQRADLFFSPNDALPQGLRCRTIVGALNVIYYYPLSLSLWKSVNRRQRWRLKLQRAYYERKTPDALRRADRVLAISNETRNQILKHVPGVSPDRVAVIYPGVPGWIDAIERRAPEATARTISAAAAAGDAASDMAEVGQSAAVLAAVDLPAQEPHFLCVSALVPYKNFDRLIEAFADFVQHDESGHRLVIVGRAQYPSYQADLEALASRLGVRNRVEFRGFVSYAELAALYRATTGFFLLSTCESFGFPILEAMSSGAPVVVSDLSTLPEIAASAGATVDPADISRIASLMRRLATSAEWRSALRDRSLTRARDFRWDATAEQFLALAADALKDNTS